MTRQAEILGGVAEYVCGICMMQGEITDSKCTHKILPCVYAKIKSREILSYIQSKGVVIKVEGELKVRHTKCDVGWYDYELLIEVKDGK